MLKDRLAKMKDEAESILEKIPEITNIWYEFTEVPIDELVEAAKEYKGEIKYNEVVGCLQLQLSQFYGITCFCYSKPITLKEAVNADLL